MKPTLSSQKQHQAGSRTADSASPAREQAARAPTLEKATDGEYCLLPRQAFMPAPGDGTSEAPRNISPIKQRQDEGQKRAGLRICPYPEHMECLPQSLSVYRQTELYLQKRLEQQELMSAIARSFISSEATATLVRNALEMSGRFLDVDKILITRRQPGGGTLRVHYEWYAPGMEDKRPEEDNFLFIPGCIEYDAFITGKLEFLAFADIAGMKEFAVAELQGVRALLCVPITCEGSFWGILSLNVLRDARPWCESDVQFASMISSIISTALTRAATEEKLLRMSSIVDSAPQFISFVDPDGSFQYVNQAGAALLGYSPEDLVGGPIEIIFKAEATRKAWERIIPEIMEKGVLDFELPAVCKGGEERILAFCGFKTHGESQGLCSIATDITDKRRLERELYEAKEQAEMSSQAKGEFLSRMSHEMRTPLNAIIGMTTISRSSTDPEKKEYCLDKIAEASTHLLGIINDILDMSKIEANKFELHNAEFDFERMLMRVVDVVNFRIDAKHQNLIVNVDESVPDFLVSDEQRLAQVIANLLSNATKFTPEQGLITLNARVNEGQDGKRLVVSIRDTGIGISEEQKERLFQSFEQADGGISRRFGGTGLGLAISRRIVELMGGEIWVESRLNKGATFSFSVPAREGRKAEATILSPDLRWRNMRALVVDDSPEVLEYFTRFARKIGLACDVAENAEDALELLKDENEAKKYNIVFVDWKMPHMNGIELTRHIKRAYQDEVVVIMISATAWTEIAEEAKDSGVDRFLHKPLFASHIVDCINQCLSRQRVPEKPRALPRVKTGIFHNRRLLLAEDVEVNREILISLLEDTGVEIVCALNGREAVDMFGAAPEDYDLIFMDIHMPEMDGYEATRIIRAMDSPKAGNIPIVAMTANVFREDVEKCLQAGMNDHLSKPLDIDEVVSKLQKHLPPL
ncbi:response regulator [Desulfovibrio sp. OttesenSCG-928-A18]|nr:response regulator [Desulfovibrio sp. OttesenSCG-928-A18]